jgi:hypothetical protein
MTRFVSRSASGARTRNGAALVVVVYVAMSLLTGSLADASPAPLHLGTTRSFAVLASDGIINIGTSTVTGNIGVYPSAVEKGFATLKLSGKNHVADTAAGQAQTALVFAYNDAVGRKPLSCVPNQLGGTTKLGYTYCIGGNATIDGTLTLDAQGHPGAVFIFQVRGGLITKPDSRVKLVHGASACNVYWALGTSATLNPSSHFVGTILARGSITATGGTRVAGRLFSRTSTITLFNTVVSKGQCA